MIIICAFIYVWVYIFSGLYLFHMELLTCNLLPSPLCIHNVMCFVQATGELAAVAGDQLKAHLPELMPMMIDRLQV